MIVDFFNRPTNVTKKQCREVIDFFCRKYIDCRILNSLYIALTFEHINDYGYCNWLNENHRPKDFLITISSKYSKKQIIKTIIHEMVHVKQFSSGKLKDYIRTSKTRWKNKTYSEKFVEQNSRNTTPILPWEIEASRLEDIIYEEYINHVRQHRKFKKRSRTIKK